MKPATSNSEDLDPQRNFSDVDRALDFNRHLIADATGDDVTSERPGVAYAGDAVEVAPESKPMTDTTARNNYVYSELDPLAASKVRTRESEASKPSSKDSETHKNDEPSTTGHHLTFASSAKQAAGQVSHKLHLHRSQSRGPSEARQRRQSSVVVSSPPHVPWYMHLRNALYGTLNLFTTFPYWDMAFWSGWAYTWGSILFVIDGAWAWTPQAWPESEFEGEAEIGVGVLFFIGALFYQLGATMAYLEAINDGEFAGPAMKRHLDGKDDAKKQLLDEKLHLFFGHMLPHHHKHDDDEGEDLEKQKHVDPEAGWRTRDRDERPGSVYPTGIAPAPRRGGVDEGPAAEEGFHEYLTWRWWPTWDCFKTYHIKQTGYIACAIQLFGATLYGICGVISLPGILDTLSPGALIGGYWVIQTIASLCFLTAGILFTLITQDVWYRPLPGRIAWWIGAWATIGSVGFLLSATFGIASGDSTWCAYQSSLSSMWGSFAYLVSSYLQWFESVNKGPVLAFPNNRIPSIMR